MFFVKILLLKDASTVCIYHGHWGNPMPESTLTLCQSQSTLFPSQGLWIWPQNYEVIVMMYVLVQHCWRVCPRRVATKISFGCFMNF